MGKQGAATREKLTGLADEVKSRARQVASDVKDEANRQGLTADSAKNAAVELGDKITTVAGAGRDSLVQKFA